MKLGDAIAGLGRPVAYYPELARFLGDVPAAILLAQLLYWRGRTAHDYLYTTDAKLSTETALTAKELRRARKLLVTIGIIMVKRAPLQHETHYTVQLDELDGQWTAWHKAGGSRRPKRAGIERDAEGKFAFSTVRKRTLPTVRKRTLGKGRKRTLHPLDHPKTSPHTPPPHCSPQGRTGASRRSTGLDAIYLSEAPSESGEDIGAIAPAREARG